MKIIKWSSNEKNKRIIECDNGVLIEVWDDGNIEGSYIEADAIARLLLTIPKQIQMKDKLLEALKEAKRIIRLYTKEHGLITSNNLAAGLIIIDEAIKEASDE